MEIVDRIKKIVENEKISYRAFEANIGKSNGYIKQVLEKKGSWPGVDVVLTIVDKYPKYNLLWIITGEGDMIGEPTPGEKEAPQKEDVRLEDIVAKRVLKELAPFIGQMTDKVIEAVLDMSMTLDQIRSEQDAILESQNNIKEAQEKTHELIQSKH